MTAVDQAGHGGRSLRGEATPRVLADAVRELYPDGPDVLVGHSLGTVTALGLLEQQNDWADTVILEEPPSRFAPEACLALAASVTTDAAAVREDRRRVVDRVRRENPRWSDEDVHWAVEGIAQMDPIPFARRFRALAHDARLRVAAPQRIAAAAPAAFVLAAELGGDGGSVLSRPDREALTLRLPAGHVITIDGGHCLHRDAPAAWLAAVETIIG